MTDTTDPTTNDETDSTTIETTDSTTIETTDSTTIETTDPTTIDGTDPTSTDSNPDGHLRPDGGEVEMSTSDERRPDESGGLSWADVRRKLLLGGIAVLALLATWATFQVYVSTSRAIGIWLSDAYVPIFQAAFNVVVVLVALAGILALVRELS